VGFKRDADGTFMSPDKKMRVEQYAKKQEDGGRVYQFWTFDRDHRHAFRGDVFGSARLRREQREGAEIS
jgi:hypothetical protein